MGMLRIGLVLMVKHPGSDGRNAVLKNLLLHLSRGARAKRRDGSKVGRRLTLGKHRPRGSLAASEVRKGEGPKVKLDGEGLKVKPRGLGCGTMNKVEPGGACGS